MKQLLLCRHAKSSWKHPKLADIDRPLNKRGKRNARWMGRLLADMAVQPDLIISSPARRARTTANRLARKIGYVRSSIVIRKELYFSSLTAMMTCIHELPEDSKRVMLVGHNPIWTDLAYELAGLDLVNIPTCSIAAISFPVSFWQNIQSKQGQLDFFLRPPTKKSQ